MKELTFDDLVTLEGGAKITASCWWAIAGVAGSWLGVAFAPSPISFGLMVVAYGGMAASCS